MRTISPPSAVAIPFSGNSFSARRKTCTSVKGYEVYVGSASTPRQSPSRTTATIDGLTCGTSYPISVLAVDRAGNRSARTSGQFSTAVCPLKVQFLGAKVVPLKGGKRLVVTLRSSVRTKGSAALFVAKKRVARAGISLRAGKNALGFRMPRGSGRRNVRLLLRLVDPKGGARNLTFRMTVRL